MANKPIKKKAPAKKQPYCHRCKKHLSEKSIPKHIKMHSDKGEGHSITYPGKKGKKAYRPKTTPPATKKKRRASLIDARVGNEFWKKRIKHGRDKIFSSPEMLWDCCMEYFKWCEANPLQEEKIFSHNGKTHTGKISRMRAMTVEGLALFLGVGSSTWYDYAGREDFSAICKAIEEVMVTQKFSGAAAGFLNHAIIARHLGLVDKSDVTVGLSVVSMDEKDKNT